MLHKQTTSYFKSLKDNNTTYYVDNRGPALREAQKDRDLVEFKNTKKG